MLRLLLPGVPIDAVVYRESLRPSRTWVDWFTTLARRADATVFRVQTVNLIGQGASVTATAVPISALTAGLYRVSYALRVTRPATSSSSATVTVGWTDGTVACAQAFAAVTGNTTATVQSGTALVRCDASSVITYAVVYASSGATSMQFALDVVVEAVPGVAA